jgi:hypothetical protein
MALFSQPAHIGRLPGWQVQLQAQHARTETYGHGSRGSHKPMRSPLRPSNPAIPKPTANAAALPPSPESITPVLLEWQGVCRGT